MFCVPFGQSAPAPRARPCTCVAAGKSKKSAFTAAASPRLAAQLPGVCFRSSYFVARTATPDAQRSAMTIAVPGCVTSVSPGCGHDTSACASGAMVSPKRTNARRRTRAHIATTVPASRSQIAADYAGSAEVHSSPVAKRSWYHAIMERTLYREEHEMFRQSFRQFVEREIVPHQERWREAGMVDREMWRKAGQAASSARGSAKPTAARAATSCTRCIVMEELARVYESGFAMALHSDIIVPYIHAFGTEEQKQRWLPGCASGELVTAIAMTEPGTGSRSRRDRDDRRAATATTTSSTARRRSSRTASSATCASSPRRPIPIRRTRTRASRCSSSRRTARASSRARSSRRWAWRRRTPASCSSRTAASRPRNLLGDEGAGFIMLMQKLQQERLCVAIGAQAGAEQVLDDTIAYTQGAQGVRQADLEVPEHAVQARRVRDEGRGRPRVRRQARRRARRAASTSSRSARWRSSGRPRWRSEVVDTCLQFFGGYGYMLEYPVTRAFMDARVQRIYAGTNEIMKMIIAKQMGL